ncbi:MAG: hypothetical protein UZ19_OD1000147 [Parcubacteria bacterium OLB19]|nr:MAG: hypothetical protein UZ19_OD1000147 [Parcubacteria bacterium OLB19]
MLDLLRILRQTLLISKLKEEDNLVVIKTILTADDVKFVYVAPKGGLYKIKELVAFTIKLALNFPLLKIHLPYKTIEGNLVFGELWNSDYFIRIIVVPDSTVLALMEERKYVTISCFSVRMYGFFKTLAQHFLEH